MTTNAPTGGCRDELVVSIVDAVAAASGCEPAELQPLHDVVDPDALQALFAGAGRSTGRIRFAYGEYTVVVDADGNVLVRDGPDE
ncbi:hypothetical protein Halru_3106 [Halovivax ruber XH-70]|uniref:Halobacterial output domain-containing protein n=1 Tax=Halovivax ruber (strain DSM 18193 / JCM 13892 / XH-70) TaxID=797302 RepID=L0II62_HALRX|nr:HalOD1 output domain-containing protein [Halovivax ruber]AGB17672.1 hypothetical protein Halru_3106 [Halovivax ruber XH-70]